MPTLHSVPVRADPWVTAAGAPVVLARNLTGYSSLRPRRQGRWGTWEKDDTAFNLASAFLKDRNDICVPVELLTDLIEEDSKLHDLSRCTDLQDTLCPELSWPGSCLEDLSAELGGSRDHPSSTPPLLAFANGPDNGHLSLMRPRLQHLKQGRNHSRGKRTGFNGTVTNGVPPPPASRKRALNPATIDKADGMLVAEGARLALHAGPIRQIAHFVPRPGSSPKVFTRCDFSATLISVSGRGVDNDIGRRPQAGGQEAVEDLVEEEKLVFSKRLTSVVCSPYTRAHAAFLDEECRLFTWQADRGAVMHGAGPLRLAAPIPKNPARIPESDRAIADARRSRNADVSLDFGNHPRVLWMAAQHQAYRVDLRQKPSPSALQPALNPGVYFETPANSTSILHGAGKSIGGRGEEPRIRALTVGRRSVYELFVAAGLQLACMDIRFPGDAVTRWDLPQEVDALRWLPGLPGEGTKGEEIILASGRRSPNYYINTWASDAPRWRGCQTRLGLDETSPAASAARRPLTFSLPATPLGETETRSGGLILALPPDGESDDIDDGLCFVHATSAGDVYGQRLRTGRTAADDALRGQGHKRKAVPATHCSPLFSDRIQSMLPCGAVCLDKDDADSSSDVKGNGKKVIAVSPAAAETTSGVQAVVTNPDRTLRKPGKPGGVGERKGSRNDGEHESNGGQHDQPDRVGRVGEASGEKRDDSEGYHILENSSTSSSSSSSSSSSDLAEDDQLGWGALTQPRRSKKRDAELSPREEHAAASGSRGIRRGLGDNVSGDAQETDGFGGHSRAEAGVAAAENLVLEKRVEYFPVNAVALRPAVEKVPAESLSYYRRLPPLAQLVARSRPPLKTAGQPNLAASKEGVGSRTGVPSASERRERDFSDLRDYKAEVAEFLLKPRTPRELLIFCRKSLQLKFPPNPPATTDERPLERNSQVGSGSGPQGWTKHGAINASVNGEPTRKRIDDVVIASDISRAVLAWGAPFREIETVWKPAAIAQGYQVADPFPEPRPCIRAMVLCSTRNLLRGKPSPLLGPATFGEPLSNDVTIEDVRWLKDQWDGIQ